MIFNVSGGGGTALNFRVVGNPKPSTAKENTIWIDTDVPITSYIFSATQPTAASGRVWIPTGTSSPVEFNALRKNGIQVYPMAAKQYVSGAWVNKEAKSYQNGKWEEWWKGGLYDYGEEYTIITGGWVQSSESWAFSMPNTGTVTKKADRIEFKSGSNTSAAVTTVNKIDLTNWNRLDLEFTDNSNGNGVFGIHKNPGAFTEGVIGGWICEIGMSFDLSAIDGEYYISVGIGNRTETVTLHRMTLS